LFAANSFAFLAFRSLAAPAPPRRNKHGMAWHGMAWHGMKKRAIIVIIIINHDLHLAPIDTPLYDIKSIIY
jgi:hypothetical protein